MAFTIAKTIMIGIKRKKKVYFFFIKNLILLLVHVFFYFDKNKVYYDKSCFLSKNLF